MTLPVPSPATTTKENPTVSTDQTAIDFRAIPPKLTPTPIGWQAWWEDNDMWDGNVLYADLDAAKHHAAVDYIGEEYGWVPGDDPDDEAPNTVLAWELVRDRWHLMDGSKDTGVQLYKVTTYTAA